MKKDMTAIEKVFDENNNDNIILYNNDDEPIEFEQIAIVPMDEDYCILKPIKPFDGMNDNEAIVFQLKETEDPEQSTLEIVVDEEIIDEVFDVYYKLLDKALEEDKK